MVRWVGDGVLRHICVRGPTTGMVARPGTAVVAARGYAQGTRRTEPARVDVKTTFLPTMRNVPQEASTVSHEVHLLDVRPPLARGTPA